ncbi:lysozyme [Pseudomonas sp.]|uniref:lysozyme n=1 Tax=Pseudomonas sp. TaxID=306 RepID=UPI00333E96E1
MTTPNQQSNKGRIGGIAAGIALATGFLIVHEGEVLGSYADPVHGWEVPTACYGQTGPHIRMGQVFTRAECRAMLDAELVTKAQQLDRCITRPLPDHSAAAVLSLAYNVGTSAVCGSTLVRQINAGQPPAVYCQQLDRWVYAGGKDCRDPRNNCRGIAKRRTEEKALCLGNL